MRMMSSLFDWQIRAPRAGAFLLPAIALSVALIHRGVATAQAPAIPSFNGTMEQGLLTLNFGTVEVGDAVAPITFDVFNLINGGPTSTMSLVETRFLGDSGRLSLSGLNVQQLTAASSAGGQITLDTRQAGEFQVSYVLAFQSDAIQGGEELLLAIGAFADVLNPADFSGDRIVDGRDFLLWQGEFGFVGDSPADGNHDGRVDGADYLVWRNAFPSASLQVAAITAVPEPAFLVASLVACLATFANRRRRAG